MDMSKYKDNFLVEAREHLDTLNECLLTLEKEPENKDNINQLFRSFHTLKGNSATMGFMKFSQLAHDLEDVLDKVRNGGLEVSEDLIDLLLDGCDSLDSGLEAINNDKSEELNIESVLEKINVFVPKTNVNINVNIGELTELNDEQKQKINDAKNESQNIFRAIIEFKSDNILKAAKAQLILKNLEEYTIIKHNPPKEDIKSNKFENKIELVIAAQKEKEDIENTINKVTGVQKLTILGLEEKYTEIASPPSEHAQKEIEKKKIVDSHKEQFVKQIQTVKVDIKRLDTLMNLVGELLINNLHLNQFSKSYDDKEFSAVMNTINRLIAELQENVMQVRMVPIGNIFNRFPRMVRDLAKKENKKLNLIVEGSEIEFDRTVLDEIGEPLVHLLRNSVDHGIEDPESRIDTGKSETGTVRLIARREKNNAIIDIIDDGAGIDAEVIKKSALRKKIISQTELDSMTKSEIQKLIFRPGLSTNKEVTEVSGRGVGMDVVETKIKSLGGSVKLKSILGKGTTISLQLPLTLAIVACLLVRLNSKTYSIPLNNIERTVYVTTEEIKTIQGKEVFILRGTEIPLVRLQEVFNLEKKKQDKLVVVVIENAEERFGLVVDKIIGQEQILIKSLDKMVRGVEGLAGATIMGDGTVSLILDVGTLT